jgi:hypothetical protein
MAARQEHRLEITALPNPDRAVREAGFDLTHPYVEQCWGALIGPSGAAILRRLPLLWAESEPAVVDARDLAGLGLGAGAGEVSRFNRALDRLNHFHLAVWTDRGHAIGVYTQVPPVTEPRMARLPDWTRQAHAGHLDHALVSPAQSSSGHMSSSDAWRERDRLAGYTRPDGKQPRPATGEVSVNHGLAR